MKKYLFLFLGMTISVFVNAQDMMLLRNGDELHCKVEMINNGIINYTTNGTSQQLPTTQLYMIKYEKRGNAFFNSNGESSYNSESTSSKLSKKDIAIYLCEGGEIIASEINITKDEINYKLNKKKGWNIKTGLIHINQNGDWNSLSRDNVFLIRYFDGTREVINDLQRIEEQTRIDVLPKVKHPFIPINKDNKYPCPAEIEVNNGTRISVIIYDLEREYVHYRKKDWQDGPIYRMQRNKIKEIITK